MTRSEITLSLKDQYEEIEHLSHHVEEFCAKNHVSENMIYPLNVVLDEVVTNIISYAWKDRGHHILKVNLKIENQMFTAVVTDDGQPFNPLEVEDLDVSVPVEERRIGGLGLHFVKNLMDILEYKRSGERNILTLRKILTG